MSGRTRDHLGRPFVAVTGIGLVTPLGLGVAESWAGAAGRALRHHAASPASRPTTCGPPSPAGGPAGGAGRHAAAPPPRGSSAWRRWPAEEAVADAGIGGDGDFPGPLFLGMPPVEVEWPHRLELARGRPTARRPARYPAHDRRRGRPASTCSRAALFGGVGERLADRFGTRGAPISLTTACATGASAIQLGVEAIQRGETDAALCIGAEGSVQPEALIRFSLLSALSTRNDDPDQGLPPLREDPRGLRDEPRAPRRWCWRAWSAREARGAKVLGLVLGCGERADSFHRTRSNPDGARDHRRHARRRSPMPGSSPSEIDYINAHGTGTPENDKMETLGMRAVFGEPPPPISSNKSMIGHTLSAAGAIEAVFSLLTIRDQLLPPTINHETPDPAVAAGRGAERGARRRR